jgi:hypothetical protein
MERFCGNPCVETTLQTETCRAISGWGVNSKIWAPFLSGAPLKKNSGKQKFFHTFCDNGGLKILFQTFFDLNFSKSGAPSGEVGPPFLTFLSPHPPSSSDPASKSSLFLPIYWSCRSFDMTLRWCCIEDV